MPSSVSRSTLIACVLVACSVAFSSVALAQTEDDEAATYAVQNRQYKLGHEFNAGIGILPIDAFNKALLIGGGYTYHLNSSWAWEVVQFYYAVQIDTGLKNELKENFMVEPTMIQNYQMLITTNLTLTPFYGKFALGNRTVVHAEIYLALGGGVANYVNPGAWRPVIDGGAGIRFYLSEHVSLRLDVRDLFVIKLQNAGQGQHFSPLDDVLINLSLALSFGGASR